MREDYLWDGSGEPDPEVQKLESLLVSYRHNQPPPAFDQLAVDDSWSRRSRLPGFRFSLRFAAVAAVLLIGVSTLVLFRARKATEAGSAWEIARIAGAPRVGWHTLSANSGTARLKVGQTLVTDNSSRASVTLDETGQIEVDPQSRLRVVASRHGHERLSLERGTIHATIWAPPGEFVVDTPSAVAVDLGCVYTLHVDDSGAGLLRTTMGWVGFKLQGHESFIPAGAVCLTRPKIGPGTPYFEDTSPALRDALSKLDFARLTPEQRILELRTVLHDATKQDALTLWHLLSRVSDAERPGVYDRLATLAPPPGDVTREGVLRLDQKMLDSWWNSLGYGDVYLWHMFERTWPEQERPRS